MRIESKRGAVITVCLATALMGCGADDDASLTFSKPFTFPGVSTSCTR